MDIEQKKFLNALNCISGIGIATLYKIKNFFKGDFKSAFVASESKFIAAGISGKELEAIRNNRFKVDPEKEWEKLKKEEIEVIAYWDNNYPEMLKHIHFAPILLYVKGTIIPEDRFAFGIVGTRLATDYGKQTAFDISFKLSQIGLTIVSGLAYGIDSSAHKGALEAGGRTIAVLANGLDEKSIFPKENLRLARKIIKNGALISEYPVGTEASKEKFPQRNRIVSGLSKGILVVEAPLKSGSLITAKYALDQNREVFAVPGDISSRMSFGTNLLIKRGAVLVTRVQDILDELNIEYKMITEKKELKLENENEKKIFSILNKSSKIMHIDEIVRKSNLEASEVSSALVEMEMRGIVENLGEGRVRVKN